jgi:hypothetical protein
MGFKTFGFAGGLEGGSVRCETPDISWPDGIPWDSEDKWLGDKRPDLSKVRATVHCGPTPQLLLLSARDQAIRRSSSRTSPRPSSTMRRWPWVLAAAGDVDLPALLVYHRDSVARVERIQEDAGELGWVEGGSLRIEARWATNPDDPGRARDQKAPPAPQGGSA